MSRAVVPAGTVRIGKQGVARVSPDLYVASKLLLLGYDPKSKKLKFRLNEMAGLSLYKAAQGSRSGVVSLMAVLKMFGLEQEVGFTFPAKVMGEHLTIDFGKRVYVGGNR